MTSHPSSRLVAFLQNVASYPDRPYAVELVETHISWVFLTDEFAYKLKKPVRFDFLDFSTPELRHRACLEELRLNRRLAPDVYLSILPITQNARGCLALDGDGTAVDWVVKMRRLPADRALDVLLRQNLLSLNDAEIVAQHLADIYVQLPPKHVNHVAYRDALERHIRANAATLLDAVPAEGAQVGRIQTAQLRYVHLQAQLLDQRITDGRIVEGHGDLRPEHIYLDGCPIVIDCIEFSEELRTVDIADELSFLAMECNHLGHGELGLKVLAKYRQACHDEASPMLLAFYCSYRALVRAKVELLRDKQRAAIASSAAQSFDAIRAYIDLADRYVVQLGPPVLLVVGGLMGTGKSTLAAKIADAFAVDLISTDHIRLAVCGPSNEPAGYGEGNYAPNFRNRVYDELFRQAGQLLRDSQSVILDGTFLTTDLRERAYDLSNRYSTAALFIHCTSPRDVALARIQRRAAIGNSQSEARTGLYDLQARDLELPRPDEPAIAVDTTQPLPQQLSAIYAELRPLVFAG